MDNDKTIINVLLTFDFEEWDAAQSTIYTAKLYEKTRRVTDFLASRHVPATFFLDAQTTLKFPDAVKLLTENGFELALHSDHHYGATPASDFMQDQETQVSRMKNAISMIRRVIPNFDPKGFRAPGLRWNEALYDSLRELGFLYDSSQMDKYAFQPFVKNGVVVIPMNSWLFDSACYRVPKKYVVHVWKDHFRKAQEFARKTEKSYFLLILHPSVSGKFEYLGMLKAILNWLSWMDVRYVTCRELATEYIADRSGAS